jgi:hypothetical protein
MSDEHEDSVMRDEEDIDPGEPIAALAKFEHDTSSRLVGRVRRTIQRRTAVGQLTSFSAEVPVVVLREFWLILINQLNPIGMGKDASHEAKTS